MVEEKIFQCLRCTAVMHAVEKPQKCNQCECPMIREIQPDEPLDVASEESVAHLRAKVVNCLNYTVDRVTRNKTYHKLELEQDIRLNRIVRGMPEKSFLEVITQCKKCKQQYIKGLIAVTPSNREIVQQLGVLDKVEKLLGMKLDFEKAIAP